MSGSRSRKVGRRVDVEERRTIRVVRAPLPLRDGRRVEPVGQRPEPSLTVGQQGRRPGSPPLTVGPPSGSAADRRRPRAPRRSRRRPSLPRPAARGHPARSPACRRPPRPRCRRGSPPRPAATPASGPSNACASCTTRTPAGTAGAAPGATTTRTSVVTRRAASIAWASSGRPSSGSASLSRPNRDERPPARTITATVSVAVIGGLRPRPVRCPRTRHVAGIGVRRRIPRRSRSSRMAITNLRLVPVASR